MILANLVKAIREQNYYAVVLEFLIVIAGVVIGFQITAWNEEQRQEIDERIFLHELREDFRVNAAQLTFIEDTTIEIIEAMTVLLEEGGKPEPSLSSSELNEAFSSLVAMPAFSPVTRTYENLVGSGELDILDNRDLQSAIASFNRQYGVTYLVMNTHELELVGTFDPYIIENLDYTAVSIDRMDGAYPLPEPIEPDLILSKLSTLEFRNVVTLKWMISTDLLNQYQSLQASVETILALLDAELGVEDEAPS